MTDLPETILQDTRQRWLDAIAEVRATHAKARRIRPPGSRKRCPRSGLKPGTVCRCATCCPGEFMDP